MKIWKGAVLFCFAALMVGQAAAQTTGDDWKLVAYNFARVNNYSIDDKEVTVTLDTREQLIAGNSGCNRFMGPFRFEDSGRLAVGPFAGTLMACPRIDNRFEAAFRETLGNIDSFTFETGYLTLTDKRTGHFMRFQRIIKPERYTWYVNKDLEDCVGVVKTKCMQIKDTKEGAWTNFFGPIEGFAFKKGRFYAIEVERTKVANPAADGSAYSHKLIRVIKEVKKEKDL
jgi:heat shock protein HslJ